MNSIVGMFKDAEKRLHNTRLQMIRALESIIDKDSKDISDYESIFIDQYAAVIPYFISKLVNRVVTFNGIPTWMIPINPEDANKVGIGVAKVIASKSGRGRTKRYGWVFTLEDGDTIKITEKGSSILWICKDKNIVEATKFEHRKAVDNYRDMLLKFLEDPVKAEYKVVTEQLIKQINTWYPGTAEHPKKPNVQSKVISVIKPRERINIDLPF